MPKKPTSGLLDATCAKSFFRTCEIEAYEKTGTECLLNLMLMNFLVSNFDVVGMAKLLNDEAKPIGEGVEPNPNLLLSAAVRRYLW